VSTWRDTLLGDEIELAYGKALPAHSRRQGKYGVFGSNGLVGEHDEYLIDGPGVVIGRKGSVGALAFSAEPFWPIDTTYYVVNKGNHNWRYLYYLLSSCDLTGLNSHSAVPGLNREDVYSIAVRMPSRDVQDQIARVLDCVSDAIELEYLSLANAEELLRAVSRELFAPGASDLTERHGVAGWVEETIGDRHNVSSGGTPLRAVPEYWTGGTIPWVKTTEVNYSVITETSECITQRGLEESAAKMLPAGTVLLAMYGQGVTRGKVGVLGIEAASNQACAAIQARDGAVDRRYLYHFLASRYEDLRRMAHGGQQQNLNLDIVREFPILYPVDLSAQAEIVDTLDSVNEMIYLHRRRLAVLEELLLVMTRQMVFEELSLNDLDLTLLSAAEEPVEMLTA
jgi:type I restriction enzyme S subunit